MDPLSALAVASAVVQMVDFGAKVFFTSVDFFKTASGALESHVELSTLAQDLGQIASRLASTGPATSLSGQIPINEADQSPEAALGRLGAACNVLANKLVADLQRLAVQNPGRKWETFYKAARAVWKEKDIKETQAQLTNYRNQLTLHLSALLSEQQSLVLSTLRALDDEHKRFTINSRNDLNLMKHEILEAVKVVQQNLVVQDRQKKEKRVSVNVDPAKRGRKKQKQQLNIPPQSLDNVSNSFYQTQNFICIQPKVATTLLALVDQSRRIQFEENVLKSLYFETLPVRYGRIPNAHHRAFDWLLGNDLQDAPFDPMFTTWLEQEAGIYWISGKAGSGKSTLMKFLSNDKRVARALQMWASSNRLITARHFFWNAGSEEEKSQMGLLRSLLFNILCQCPDMMTDVVSFRETQSGTDYLNIPWSLSELLRAFEALKTQTFASNRFCFFIDGLDEYSGEPMDVIPVLSHMTNTGAIKICLSSRPWTPFRIAFGESGNHKLVLQDFNAPDIRLYVKTMFEENDVYLKVKDQDQRYEELAEQIVKKAEGVFLWVFLVVRSLLRGLNKFDSVKSLEKRLRTFPDDLKDFYLQMLKNIEDFYHEQMAHMLQLALHLPEPSPVLLYRYLDETNSMPPISGGIQHFDAAKIVAECHVMDKRLNARCSDFLEVYMDHSRNPVSKYRVDFLHRTAKDFLMQQEMQDHLNSKIVRPFDINRYLIRALLEQIKLAASLMPNHDAGALQLEENRFYSLQELATYLLSTVEDVLRRTLVLEKLQGETEESVLNEIEHILLFRGSYSTTRASPSGTEMRYREALGLDRLDEDGWLLGKAISAGLNIYVRSRMQKENRYCTQIYGRPPLYYAFQAQIIQASTVKLLLQAGASPNQEYAGRSSWTYLLSVLDTTVEKPNADDQRRHAEILEMLIAAGANPNLKSCYETESMSVIFSRVCAAPDAARLLFEIAQRQESKKPVKMAMSRFWKRLKPSASSGASKA